MWLPWPWAILLAGLFAASSAALRGSAAPKARLAAQFLHESTIIAVLYAAWIYVGRFTLLQIDGAVARAETLWDWERAIRMPNEASIQDFFMSAPETVQFANLYYGGMHVPMMGVFLFWFFAKHRDAYPGWRNTLAIVTALCVAIQLLPVAPPRLTPSLGMIDTGHYFEQSVFEPLGSTQIGQLQAMPSIHIAWAGLILAAAWSVGTTRVRWLAAAHFVLTFWVVVVTANHFWLDGVFALALLPLVRAGVRGWEGTTQRVRAIEHQGD